MIEEIHDHAICKKTRTIYLGQEDETNHPISHMSSLKFIKNLDILNAINKNAITLKMVSIEGGDVGHGLAMFAALKCSESEVGIYCYGSTGSFGTILLQGAAEGARYINQYSEFMIHYGSVELNSDLISAESTAEANKIWRIKMLNIYAERCINGEFFKSRKYSLNKVKNYLNTKLRNAGDWYLKSAEEVVYYGFADQVF